MLLACASTLPDTTSQVTDARVLAVQVDPAEVEEGDDLTLNALVADATGALDTASVDWSFCSARKALAELGPVSASCLDPASTDLVPIGSGVTVAATMPDDACSLFGPNPPAGEDGSGGRPTDADVTGGYYQPILGFADSGDATLVSARVRCGLPNVSQETYIAWNSSYINNSNPSIESLTLDGAEVAADGQGDPPVVQPGAELSLELSWPSCPDAGACDGAETYTVYDPGTATLTTRREAISATWFSTGGAFSDTRDGRSGSEEENSVENTWTAPDVAGEVWMAVVLRDERGGVGFGGFRVDVGD